MNNNKRKIILGSIIGVLIGTLMSVSYAFFTYVNTSGTNSTLVTGDIYMRYKESSTTININDMMPMSGNPLPSQYFEFTVEGKNTNTTKDIWYEIDITHGALPTINDKTKNENQRINDKFLKFTLKEKKDDGSWTIPINAKSYSDFSNGFRIWVDTIEKNQTTDTTHTYQLYVWVDESVTISNTKTTGVDYTMSEWNDLFASIQVNVTGDFTVKELPPTVNVMNTFPSVITDEKANIKEVYFNKMNANAMQTAYDNAEIKADLTYNNEGKVLAWFESNAADPTKYNLIVASDGDTYLTTGMQLFFSYSNVEKIEFNNINTTRVTNMKQMFAGCLKLQAINNLNNFDTSNVEDMSIMFAGCGNLLNIDFSNKGSDVLTNVSQMFGGCRNLQSVNMSNFNFGQTTTFDQLFAGLSSLNNINFDGIKMNNVTNMSSMFGGCSSLQKIYVSTSWNTNNITNSTDMFQGCTSLLVGGNGTHYSNDNPKDKTYAIIDGTNGQPGYLTDIADKTNN